MTCTWTCSACGASGDMRAKKPISILTWAGRAQESHIREAEKCAKKEGSCRLSLNVKEE